MVSERFDVHVTTATPLRGIVTFGDREPRPFEGWVSLAEAVQAIVADEPQQSPPPAS